MMPASSGSACTMRFASLKTMLACVLSPAQE